MKKNLKTKECNHCGKRINVSSRNCPFCAGRAKDPLEPRAALCPRCEVSLKDEVIFEDDHGEADICPQCGGLWLDRAEFHRATRKVNAYTYNKREGEYLRGPIKDSLEYIPCVRCGKKMNRKNFARISGVIIDECRSHGLWLDADELEKIRHFIADDGLERSRDREIENVRMELKDLATTVKQVAFTQRLIHYWNPKRWLFSGF